jgi:hypothetical protein
VRSVIERAVLEMMSRQLGVDSKLCAGKDPLASEGEVQRAPSVQKAVAARREVEAERATPYRAYSGSDPVGDTGLRRSID